MQGAMYKGRHIWIDTSRLGPNLTPSYSTFSCVCVCVCVCVCFNWKWTTIQYCCHFAIHWHESVMGVHVSPLPVNPCHLPPHPIHLGCPSAPALSALFHPLNLDWLSIFHMVIYMFQCYFLKPPHPCLFPQSPKLCFYICVSSVILHIGSSLPFF